MQGRPDRIRMTMFPEDGMDVPSTQMMRNQPTNLQRLSQPVQILKAIVSGLATYQVRNVIEAGPCIVWFLLTLNSCMIH